jgi:hypothetical protein
MGDGSTIDRHDRLLPGEGCHARVPFGLLAFGESPRGHEVLHHGALLELMFDAVCMVRTDHFEKFLEVSFGYRAWRLESRSMAVTYSSSDPSTSLSSLLQLAATATHWGHRFFPIFAAFGAFLSTFAGGFEQCPQLLPGTIFPLH